MKQIEFTNEFFNPKKDGRIIYWKDKKYAILKYWWNFEWAYWTAKVKEMKKGNILIEGTIKGEVKNE